MSTHNEFDEPIPGIPAPLPIGESILWQGSPQWFALAVNAFHVRKLAIYFSIILGLQVLRLARTGATMEQIMAGPALTLILSLSALAILCGLAWLSANATVYTLTDQRVLIRFGIALQITMNIPFKQIQAADIQTWKNGIGNIPLKTSPDAKRISYLVMWPHVRQWSFGRPQPMLRAIPNAQDVAQKIGLAAQHSIGTKLVASETDRQLAQTPAVQDSKSMHPGLSMEES